MAAYTTIDNPELYFQVKTYTGTGSSQAYTLDGDEDMAPDLVWIQNRGAGEYSDVGDTVRGATKILNVNDSIAEFTTTDIQAFGSDGFTVGSDARVNASTNTYVAWCWKATGSTASNTDGTNVTSTVDANTTAGFSIVSWTVADADDSTFGHGLGVTPSIAISKKRSGTSDWAVQYTFGDGSTDYMFLNKTDAKGDTSTYFTSTTVKDGFGSGSAAATIITYVFAPKQGFSSMGSYIGSGSSDGPFCFCGFSPSFVLRKATSGSENWVIVDNKRNTFNNGNKLGLFPNTTGADDDTTHNKIDFLSNGFKCIGTTDDRTNASGTTYIYMAFAEAPFVNSKGVPANAR